MSTPTKLFLNDDRQVINIDGVELTVAELKECVIDSRQYREALKLAGGE